MKEEKGEKITFDMYVIFTGTVYNDYETGLTGAFNYGYEVKKGRWHGNSVFISNRLTGEELSAKVVIGKDGKTYYVPMISSQERQWRRTQDEKTDSSRFENNCPPDMSSIEPNWVYRQLRPVHLTNTSDMDTDTNWDYLINKND